MSGPVGEICVLQDLAWKDTWTVSVCGGTGKPEPLATFPDRDRACAFALAERDRRRDAGVELRVHFPDDCPCYVKARMGNDDEG